MLLCILWGRLGCSSDASHFLSIFLLIFTSDELSLKTLYEQDTACTVSACLLLKEVDQSISSSFVLRDLASFKITAWIIFRLVAEQRFCINALICSISCAATIWQNVI